LQDISRRYKNCKKISCYEELISKSKNKRKYTRENYKKEITNVKLMLNH